MIDNLIYLYYFIWFIYSCENEYGAYGSQYQIQIRGLTAWWRHIQIIQAISILRNFMHNSIHTLYKQIYIEILFLAASWLPQGKVSLGIPIPCRACTPCAETGLIIQPTGFSQISDCAWLISSLIHQISIKHIWFIKYTVTI